MRLIGLAPYGSQLLSGLLRLLPRFGLGLPEGLGLLFRPLPLHLGRPDPKDGHEAESGQ
jgi:hypothetical protein